MNRKGLLFTFAALVSVLMITAGCGSGSKKKATGGTFVLATTTSAQDSGILDELIKRFEEQYPYRVKAVAVGSGAALFMGRNGDASVLMTHEPVAEKEFRDGGYSESQTKVMHNDFIIVGRPDDPAGIKNMKDPAAAVTRISEKEAPFVSRGDASGTNAMELSIWKRAGIDPQGQSWYYNAGAGMGETLRIAEEKGAYTVSDRATFIVLEDAMELKIMVQGDPGLINQYIVSVVNPKKFPKINHEGAVAFKKFLMDKDTQEFISEFGWKDYHKNLFYPR